MENVNSVTKPRVEKSEKSEFQDLVIYTTTFYGDDHISKVREKLAYQLFKNAERLGIPCSVIDGGSNQDFLETVKKIPNIELHIDSSLDMGEGRKQALLKAMKRDGSSFFLWIEPEKDSLINKESLDMMITGLRNDTSDIIVPKRKSKETMPKFQARIEDQANKRVMEISGVNEKDTKKVLDLWFGPKMFNRAAARYFVEYKSKLSKWDTVIKPVINAFKDGKRVSSVIIDYKYDQSQKESEERDNEIKNKRIMQYVQILAELEDNYWKDKI